MYSAKPGVQDLVHLFASNGIRHVVISPGSRNAPLIISFHNHPEITCYTVPDERSAAFFALGIALQINAPVAVVCTSGSAALNYYPAVAEAFYQRIPLIVITADRPVELLDQGDGQTIRQNKVFDLHTRFSANLSEEPETPILRQHNARLISEAIYKAQFPVPGPVHINFPFREPLYQKTEQMDGQQPKPVKNLRGSVHFSPEQLAPLATEFNAAEKVMILVGQGRKNSKLSKALQELQKLPQVIILSETTSNLGKEQHINGIDKVITSFHEKDKEIFKPDLLLTLGGAVVSKKIKAFLRQYPAKSHWHIDPAKDFSDTYYSLSTRIESFPETFLSALSPLIKNKEESRYREMWLTRRENATKQHELYAETAPWSDFKVFSLLSKSIINGIIHWANSSPIRYAQLFDWSENITHFSNRGTSGIDGSTSTAAGAAFMTDEPLVLITGDIAFFYDSNGLWHKHLSKNLRIILINNGGGGIFRIIEGPGDVEELETYFETRQNIDASHLCKTFGINYFTAKNEQELVPAMGSFCLQDKHAGPALLEVFTPTENNADVLEAYFKFLNQNA